MKRTPILALCAVLVFGGLTGRPAVAQTDLSKFSLAKAVPDDVFIVVSARTNPERQFLDDYWAEVSQAFMDSGILTDIWDMVLENVPDEELDAFGDTAELLFEQCEKVDWDSLFEKEFVYAGRFNTGPGFMMYEGVIMGRLQKEKAKANYKSLKALLAEVVKLVNREAGEEVVTLTETEKDGASVTALNIAGAPPGIGATLVRRNDVIIIAFGGTSMLDETLALLGGASKRKGLTETSRFKDAFAQLPPAEDTLVFWDIERMLGTIRNMFAKMSEKPKSAGEGEQPAGVDDNDDKAMAMKAVTAILDDLSIVDYIASVEWTEGFRGFSDTLTTLKDGAKSSPLYDILAGREPIRDFEKFIPKETVTFGVSSGISLSAVYDYVEGFVEKYTPDGKNTIAEFREMQKAWELDIKKDILDLFDGSFAYAVMGKDWVILAKVTDEKKAGQQFDRLLTAVNGLLGHDNALMMNDVKIGGHQFKQISHPMMMMMGGMSPPVVGCAEGHFLVGSSVNAVKTCLETAQGDHPSIKKNKRWQKEALIPEGAVTSISFTDEAKWGEEAQEGLAGLSMGLGMAGLFGAAEAPPPVQTILTTLPPLLAKLGPVVGKINFFQSTASYDTFDGTKWYTRAVQNYKKPKSKSEAKASAK